MERELYKTMYKYGDAEWLGQIIGITFELTRKILLLEVFENFHVFST